MNYHFGVPGLLIWLTHILSGLLLVFVGYSNLNKKYVNTIISLILIVAGVLASTYHLHLWYYNYKKK